MQVVARLLMLTACCCLSTAFSPANLMPHLLPPSGVWRGSTLGSHLNHDPANYTATYGFKLHVARVFKTRYNTTFTEPELKFIGQGGIVFYSLQPGNWTQLAVGDDDAFIDAAAAAVKSVAPAQVFVCPGFEPDHHIGPVGAETFGPAADFVTMRHRFADRFKAAGVTNALFVMDFSRHVITKDDWQTIIPSLWPGNSYVDWLFQNAFASKDKPDSLKGNFTQLADIWYQAFEAHSSPEMDFNSVPAWGFGAYGAHQSELSEPSRVDFVNEALSSLTTSRYPRVKAMIYFDSLDSAVTPNLQPTFEKYLASDKFTVNDPYVSN